MPNLFVHQLMDEQYAQSGTIAFSQLNRSFGTLLRTSMNQLTGGINQDWLAAFDKREKHHVVLTFLDLSNFSSRIRHMNADQIATELGAFYDVAVPLIYKHHGVIEKIIGDGIISIFGPPFCDEVLTTLLHFARSFSYEVLKELDGYGMYAKMALHDGEVMYYSPLSNYYLDYTAVGEPLTKLFRLESVAKSGSLCVYSDGNYLKCIKAGAGGAKFKRNPGRPKVLQGIGLKNITHLSIIDEEEW